MLRFLLYHKEMLVNIFNQKRYFTRKRLLEKAAALKRFEYSPLSRELKLQTSAAEKQYQKLDQVFQSNKKEEKNKISRAKSNIICSEDFTFYKYHNINKCDKRSFHSKQNNLNEFKDALEIFYYDSERLNQIMKLRKRTQEKKVVINTASKLYNKLLNMQEQDQKF